MIALAFYDLHSGLLPWDIPPLLRTARDATLELREKSELLQRVRQIQKQWMSSPPASADSVFWQEDKEDLQYFGRKVIDADVRDHQATIVLGPLGDSRPRSGGPSPLEYYVYVWRDVFARAHGISKPAQTCVSIKFVDEKGHALTGARFDDPACYDWP